MQEFNLKAGGLLNCTYENKECLEIESMMKLMDEMDNMCQSFGTFMRNFVSLSNFYSFSDTKIVFDIYMDAMMSGSDNICGSLKPKEKFMHQYFAKLSAALGFDQSELVSLFDVPSIVGTIDEADLTMPLIHQSFYYSQCEDNVNLTWEDMTSCANKWFKSMRRMRLNEGKHFNT